ncbi:hypothetical protein BDW22DRAFT_1414460 [Trametopsis cervina]|nr:hypothetical protein BDW22DRAFT_1414460 [Trametopsis cervina]
MSMSQVDLTHLVVPGVTRACRVHPTDPITELTGPILYPGESVLHMCPPCVNSVRRHEIGRHNLANGLWLGEVPDELSSLNFVEQLLIAKYRHNICVVRVDKGQRKMSANAIVFPQPVALVARVLPPAREELDLCLAILFTGSAVPTPKDYTRTPLLVRHRKVIAALQWLQLNHVDYADVEVSYNNMATYPVDEPPVAVLHRPTDVTIGALKLVPALLPCMD